jgi:hypothetical protein
MSSPVYLKVYNYIINIFTAILIKIIEKYLIFSQMGE